MKKVMLIILLLTLSFCSESTKNNLNKKSTFVETFGGADPDFGKSVIQDIDGGFAITGCKGVYDISSRDLWLIKTDIYGNEEWNRIFGGEAFDSGEDLQQTNDEGFILTGWTNSYGAGDYDLWLVKTDADGNEEWNYTFGDTGEDRGFAVKQTADFGFIVAGFASLSRNGESNAWLIKTDSTGSQEWGKTFHLNYFDCAYDVDQTTDEGYIMTGNTTSLGTSYGWLIKTDENGNEEWRTDFPGLDVKACYSLAKSGDGGFVVTGYTEGSQDDTDVIIIKIDEYGDTEWHVTYDDSGNEKGNSITVTSESNFIVTGYKENVSGDMSELLLLKLTGGGNLAWSKIFDLSLRDYGYDVIEASDSGYVVTGMTEIDEEGEVLLMKTDENGNVH